VENLENSGVRQGCKSVQICCIYAQRLENKYNKQPSAPLEGYFNELYGTYYGHNREYEKSVYHFRRSLDAYKKTSESTRLMSIYQNLAFLLNTLNRYGESFVIQREAIEQAGIVKDTVVMIEMLHQHCLLQTRLGLLEEAVQSTRRAFNLERQSGQSTYYSYTGLARVYESWPGKRDSSRIYYQKALKIAKAFKNDRQIAIEQVNLARLHNQAQDFARAHEFATAAMLYFQDHPVEKIALSKIYATLARSELGLGRHQKALEFADKALEITRTRSDFLNLSIIYETRAQAYAGLGDYQKAYEESVASQVAADSVAAREKSRLIADISAQYRTQEQENTIAQQTLQLERTRSRNQLLLAGALLIILIGSGFVWYLRQKKHRAELELRLRQAETQQLRDLDRAKSVFFANISHEFRTPLTLILSPLRDLRNQRFKGDLPRAHAMMERNAERLLGLVNQLLELSRLESGKLQLMPEPSDIHAHLRTLAGSFESLAAQKAIHFQTNIGQTPAWVSYDRDKLEKIVANLLSNAFKFTHEEGQVSLTATLQSIPKKNDHQALTIAVSDTGIGIPAPILPRIFERFFQVENNESDGQPGSGIGLALTKELVELMQCQIAVESTENQGSTFHVTLPLAKAEAVQSLLTEAPASPTIPVHPYQQQHPSPGNYPVVLVVEDNPDVREYLQTQLQTSYRILVAENGTAGLEIAQSEIPDLILTDLMMPGTDGMAMTRLLKSDVRTSHIPIVMLTAKAEREDRIEGIGTGAEAYLTKPIDSEEMHVTIANLLKNRSLLFDKFSREISLGASKLPEQLSLDEQWLHKVLQAIEENMENEFFGVEQLADKLAMSRSNLFRKLSAMTGESPVVLIRKIRLQRARQLLEQGAGNVSEVAIMTGFSSRTYFAKCFTDEFGHAPSVVKK